MKDEMKWAERLMLLDNEEFLRRAARVRGQMEAQEADLVVVSDPANLFYLTGRVFGGWAVLARRKEFLDRESFLDGEARFFVRRPSTLWGDGVAHVRKPEEILPMLGGLPEDCSVAFEYDQAPYSLILRLQKAFADLRPLNASPIMRRARAVKTAFEIEQMRLSGQAQSLVYTQIPWLYKPGMTDLELQMEIEYSLRRHGCLGLFRTGDPQMEIFMGNVMTGDNADMPPAYDFAMGGAGQHPSLPLGADGTRIDEGMPVMVDVNGNFTGYMTDMTRCYALGDVPDAVEEAHQLSVEICHAVARAALPGVHASDLYELGLTMARQAGLESSFMGHRAKAGFIGHGVGIVISEEPVLSPRSRDILQEGNTFACEPKFVLPDFGAVGIENTYVVAPSGPAKPLTLAPEHIMRFQG